MNNLGSCAPYNQNNTYVNIHKASNGFVLNFNDKEYVFTTFAELVKFLKEYYGQ